MVPELFLIGLVAGFLYYERVGISPGGVIPPAYFALFLHEPERVATTLVLSLAVYGVALVLQKYTFLYGRRRLLTVLLLGFCAKYLVEFVLAPAIAAPFEIHAIGYLVPGLVANDMVRQGALPTLLSLGIVSIVTALVGMLFGVGWGIP